VDDDLALLSWSLETLCPYLVCLRGVKFAKVEMGQVGIFGLLKLFDIALV